MHPAGIIKSATKGGYCCQKLNTNAGNCCVIELDARGTSALKKASCRVQLHVECIAIQLGASCHLFFFAGEMGTHSPQAGILSTRLLRRGSRPK